MRVLILDDMAIRHEGFKIILAGHELVHARRFQDFVRALETEPLFGMVCLDHDLADAFVDADWEERGYGRHFLDGRDAANWLCNHPEKCPKNIVIHSHNHENAIVMDKILRDKFPAKLGYRIIRRAYEPPAGLKSYDALCILCNKYEAVCKCNPHEKRLAAMYPDW